MRAFNFQITLKGTFSREIENSRKNYSPLIYYNSKTQTVINDLDIALEAFHKTIFLI